MLEAAHIAFRRLSHDEVAIDGVTPEQVGPLLASNQIILYELIQEGADLERVFLSLTSGLGFGEVAQTHATHRLHRPRTLINAIRAELIKMRSMPGVWVAFGIGFPLTALICLAVFAMSGGFPGHTFYLRNGAEGAA